MWEILQCMVFRSIEDPSSSYQFVKYFCNSTRETTTKQPEIDRAMGLEFKPYFAWEEGEEHVKCGSDENNRALAPALAAMNGERREYAVLVASEDNPPMHEDKRVYTVVLDYVEFVGQGKTKESSLRDARTLLHYALGSMLLKNETIPAPSTGAELEAKKAAVERDWLRIRVENFSMELTPLQFQPGIDYMACPPESDDENESDRENE